MEKTIIWKIEIYPLDTDIYGSESILDTQSHEYQNFLDNLYGIFDRYDFELYDSHKSSYIKNGSQSEYFDFVKFDDKGNTIKIMVEVRTSDHEIRNKSNTDAKKSGDKVHIRNLNERAAKISDELGIPRIPVVRFVNIVFDGENYTSYDVALSHIEMRVRQINNSI